LYLCFWFTSLLGLGDWKGIWAVKMLCHFVNGFTGSAVKTKGEGAS